MAKSPKLLYPAQVTGSDPAYPHGKARNRAVPGDGTGTPWEAQLVNDLFGWQQALLKRAGIAPNEAPETADASQYVQAIASFTKDLNAGYLLAFTEIQRGASLNYAVTPVMIASCLDLNFKPYLVHVTSTYAPARNRGLNPADTIVGAFPSGSSQPIVALSGGQEGVLVALDAAVGRTFASRTAGETWEGAIALPSAGAWTSIAYSSQLSLWLAIGASKAAKSPAWGAMAWTAGSGAVGPATRLVVPRFGENGIGAAVITGNFVPQYTLDGNAYSQMLSFGVTIVDICWSEALSRWIALGADGHVWAAPALNASWVTVANLWFPGPATVYRRMLAVGRYLIIIGKEIGGAANRTVGSVLVTDLSWIGAFTVDGGDHELMIEFDGRVVLARKNLGPIDFASSARMPQLIY